MPAKYSLRAPEIMALAARHSKEVIRRLPRKPLHTVPLREIIFSTAEVVRSHPDFQGRPDPVRGDKLLYSRYELANQLYLQRIASQLKAEGLIQDRHVDLLKTALGKLYDNPPAAVTKAQLAALEQLLRRLGHKKLERIIARAGELYGRNYKEHRTALTDEESKRAGLADMFANPAGKHRLGMIVSFSAALRKNKPILEQYQDRLRESYSRKQPKEK